MKRAIIIIFVAVSSFYACNKKEEPRPERRVTGTESLKYIEVGKNVSNITFKVLKDRLMNAMKQGGVKGAIQYCSAVAYPLTDSVMRKELNVKIKRATHKARNPKNKADYREMQVIEEYMELMKNGSKPTPVVGQLGESMRYYAPIFTLGLCMNCHGDPNKNIGKDNYNFIKSIYPNDSAVGFKEGELRGIWSIEFNTDL